MERVVTRPATPDERFGIGKHLRAARSRKDALFAAFMAFGISSCLLAVIVPENRQNGVRFFLPFVIIVGISWYTYHRMYQFQLKMSDVDLLQQDLQDGIMEVTSYEITDAIAIEEHADLGNQYFLHLVDGRVLYLCGQYLDEWEENVFPNTHFEFVHTQHAKAFLELRCLGTPFAPSSRRPDFTKAEYADDKVPQDHDILSVDFDSLR